VLKILKTKQNDQRGMTLVEALVAMLLLSFGLLAAAPMFVQSARQNTTGADLGVVAAVAREQMESLRWEDYSALTAGGSLNSDTTGFFDGSTPGITIRWQIVTNISPANTKTISVRVIADSIGPGAQRDLVLTTLRGDS
jgi:prepilin-type N-terminal cleavage/methylation domain-containing protein